MKTLIFDFDGTIADSYDTLLGVFEGPLKQIIKYLRLKPSQSTWLALKAKSKIARQIASVQPFDGIPAVIKQLHQEGHRLLILSNNSPTIIADFLRANKLSDYVDDIQGNIGILGKAGPLKRLIEAQKIDKNHCVYIGDEVSDIEAAKRAGITPVAVGWGFNLPDALQRAGPFALARQPKDLLKILSN